jgi:hypothetical protein
LKTPSAPGTGKIIRYRTTDIFTWAIGLALADFGLGPESITQMLKHERIEVAKCVPEVGKAWRIWLAALLNVCAPCDRGARGVGGPGPLALGRAEDCKTKDIIVGVVVHNRS